MKKLNGWKANIEVPIGFLRPRGDYSLKLLSCGDCKVKTLNSIGIFSPKDFDV